MTVKSVEIGASLNNYDIIKNLEEDNIRNIISSEYQEFIDKNECNIKSNADALDVNKYVDEFISSLKENYHRVDTSTDFMLYIDDYDY